MGKTLIWCITLMLGILACSKPECRYSESETILLPPPHTDWFRDLSSDFVTTARSNNGQTASVQFSTGYGSRREGDELRRDAESCKRIIGYLRYLEFSVPLYGYKVQYGVEYQLNDKMPLTISCNLETSDNRTALWSFEARLDSNTFTEKVRYNSAYETTVISDTNLLNYLGPQIIDGTGYPQVYKIEIALSKNTCKPTSIRALYFDKLKGLVKYELNNGTEWYIKY